MSGRWDVPFCVAGVVFVWQAWYSVWQAWYSVANAAWSRPDLRRYCPSAAILAPSGLPGWLWAPSRTPKKVKGEAKGGQREARGRVRKAKGTPNGSQGAPRGSQGEAKGMPGEPKGRQARPGGQTNQKTPFSGTLFWSDFARKWCQNPAKVEKAIS